MSPHKTVGYVVSKTERKSYREEAFPMLFLSFGLVNGGLVALLNPEKAAATSVSQLLEGPLQALEYAWLIAYTVAGLLLAVGVLRPWPVAEVLGEWIAVWAMLFNVLALLILRGVGGGGTSLGAFLFASAVCLVRIRILHRRAARDRRVMDQPFLGPERRSSG